MPKMPFAPRVRAPHTCTTGSPAPPACIVPPLPSLDRTRRFFPAFVVACQRAPNLFRKQGLVRTKGGEARSRDRERGWSYRRSMALDVRPLHPLFAGEVGAIDLRRIEDRPTLDAIRAAMDQHADLFFREQPFTYTEQLAFARPRAPFSPPPLRRQAAFENRCRHPWQEPLGRRGADRHLERR